MFIHEIPINVGKPFGTTIFVIRLEITFVLLSTSVQQYRTIGLFTFKRRATLFSQLTVVTSPVRRRFVGTVCIEHEIPPKTLATVKSFTVRARPYIATQFRPRLDTRGIVYNARNSPTVNILTIALV